MVAVVQAFLVYHLGGIVTEGMTDSCDHPGGVVLVVQIELGKIEHGMKADLGLIANEGIFPFGEVWTLEVADHTVEVVQQIESVVQDGNWCYSRDCSNHFLDS